MNLLQNSRSAIASVCEFVELFREEFGRSERRARCGQYIAGLILPGERKSIAPLAQRVGGSDVQALQQFVNQSPWDQERVQRKLVDVVSKRHGLKKAILIVDDSSLPKKGEASVGVAPQYCGALGKVANCQNVVTLQAVAGRLHFPVAARLYLPQRWTDDRARLEHAGVPERYRQFREKWRIALELIDETQAPFSTECVVFDAGYGEIRPFLTELDKRELTFVGQIPEHHSYWPIDVELNNKQQPTGRPRRFPAIANKNSKARSAKEWGNRLKESAKWKKVRLASGALVQAAAVRVREVAHQAYYRPGPERWLIVEQLADGTTRYFVSNASKSTSLRNLITWVHSRWCIEQGYQQLKEELGLDHFEGRSWQGLHHHIVLCFMAFCFLILWKRSKKRAA